MSLRRWLRRSSSIPEPAVSRAWRTGAAVRQAGEWVWPHWLDRQRDPASPAFVPLGDLPLLANVTRRNWTVVGNLDSDRGAAVDPRGLVTPGLEGWSLDWWIGADDRWHVPAREAGVRQRLVDASPVVETSARIPGGDAVQRVYAIRRSSAEGGGELVVVEVENLSKVPVALALAVRPYDARGVAAVEQIDLDGTTVVVDGRPALLLPRPPARVAASTLDRGDSALVVLSGDAPASWTGPVRCPAGLAQAAFVYPLAHGATLRVALPLDEGFAARGDGGVRRGGVGPVTPDRDPAASSSAFPSVVPPAAPVAKGWEAQSRRGLRLDLPDQRLSDAVEANRRFLLLLHHRAGRPASTGEAVGDRLGPRDAALVMTALDHQGFHDEAARLLLSYVEHQRADGRLPGLSPPADVSALASDDVLLLPDPGRPPATDRPAEAGAANAPVLWALARHWRLTGDRKLAEALVEHVALAARWLDRHQRRGAPAGDLGDAVWGAAGLRAAADLLVAAGQPAAAADATRAAEAVWPEVESSLSVVTGIEVLAASTPLGLVPDRDPRAGDLVEAARRGVDQTDGRAVVVGAGDPALSPLATLRLASAELRAGDPGAADRLAWLLDVATSTWTWPTALHPRLPGGTAGDGHDVVVAAGFLSFVRDLLVREDGEGLALASVVPAAWLGQGWEVHDAPTAHGRLSYAVRWHGPRPALLWELEPHGDDADAEERPPVRLSAPGLDPEWSSTERRGEALLAPVELPSEAPREVPSAPDGSLS